MIEIKLTGDINFYEKLAKATPKIIQQGLAQAGVYAMGQVKLIINSGTGMWKSPVDTGQMRQNITYEQKGFEFKIKPGASTPYAKYVHEGTYKMKKRPFFEITKERKEKDIAEIFQKYIEKNI